MAFYESENRRKMLDGCRAAAVLVSQMHENESSLPRWVVPDSPRLHFARLAQWLHSGRRAAAGNFPRGGGVKRRDCRQKRTYRAERGGGRRARFSAMMFEIGGGGGYRRGRQNRRAHRSACAGRWCVRMWLSAMIA